MSTIGWDIGGVNTKTVRVTNAVIDVVRSRPYELQRDPRALVPLLRELAAAVGAAPSDAHAVTMTAELSQMFRTKREGVAFVLDAVEAAFPESIVRIYTVDGRFASTHEARRDPLLVAAANWSATAHQVAAAHPDALLIDIGTTSTDIIPIADGRVVASGRTDPTRLASRELVYTGALRTPIEAIVTHVPYGPGTAGVSAECFALVGDVHVWRGDLDPDDYSCPTPDGRPPTRVFAGERLARIVCGDREMVDEAAISAIADAVAHAQLAQVASAISQVAARHRSIRVAVVTGLGSFIGTTAANAAGLEVIDLADSMGDGAARCAPAASVALLLEASSDDRAHSTAHATEASRPDREAIRAAAHSEVDTVVKIGGGLLAVESALDDVLEAVAAAARSQRLLIVPGGGPFADVVRDADRQHRLSDDAAHWMAILAMDQYAYLIASKLAGGVLVTETTQTRAALEAGRVPVLAPSMWLKQVDPLPHTWDVTSDSIAAWIAGQVGAARLMLIKPPHAEGALVDAYFERVLPSDVLATVVPADRLDVLIHSSQRGTRVL